MLRSSAALAERGLLDIAGGIFTASQLREVSTEQLEALKSELEAPTS